MPKINNPMTTTIGSRIKTARLALNLTQQEFADSLGIVQGFLSGIERGRKTPSGTLLIALRHYYKISNEWLNSGVGGMFREIAAASEADYPSATKIPLLKRIPPGFPQEIAADAIHDYVALPNLPEGCYALLTDGDYMAPTIRDGDLAIFNPNGEVNNRDIVLINNRWGEAILRRYRLKGGEVYLTPDNPSYAPFKPDKDTKTIGTVVEVWRKIKL